MTATAQSPSDSPPTPTNVAQPSPGTDAASTCSVGSRRGSRSRCCGSTTRRRRSGRPRRRSASLRAPASSLSSPGLGTDLKRNAVVVSIAPEWFDICQAGVLAGFAPMRILFESSAGDIGPDSTPLPAGSPSTSLPPGCLPPPVWSPVPSGLVADMGWCTMGRTPDGETRYLYVGRLEGPAFGAVVATEPIEAAGPGADHARACAYAGQSIAATRSESLMARRVLPPAGSKWSAPRMNHSAACRSGSTRSTSSTPTRK